MQFIFNIAQSDFALLTLLAVLIIILSMILSTHWQKIKPLLDQKYALPLIFILLSPLAIMAFIEIFKIVTAGVDGFGDDKRGYTILLAALAGAPFVIWRTWIAQKQGIVAEQGHMTDRISKAVEQLGAEKTVWVEGKQSTEPNLEVRIGAIYALERISHDSMRDHISVMEILCAYIRNNSPALDHQKSPHEVFDFLTRGHKHEQPLVPEVAFKDKRYKAANPNGWRPAELDGDTMRQWAKELPELRNDIQTALDVIGRRPPKAMEEEQRKTFTVNLKKCNLQKATLSGNFSESNFDGTHFDGATLRGLFVKVKATLSSWQGVDAKEIDVKESIVLASNLNYAFFGGASFDHSDIRLASLKGTNFNGASVKYCDWYNAKISKAFFYRSANASYGRFHDCDPQELKGIKDGPSKNLLIVEKKMQSLFPESMLLAGVQASGNERDVYMQWKATLAGSL